MNLGVGPTQIFGAASLESSKTQKSEKSEKSEKSLKCPKKSLKKKGPGLHRAGKSFHTIYLSFVSSVFKSCQVIMGPKL